MSKDSGLDETRIGSNSAERLQQFIDEIEKLDEQKQKYADFQKQSYAKAKTEGFDPKIMRQIIKRRKMERALVEEQDQMVAVYELALSKFKELLE